MSQSTDLTREEKRDLAIRLVKRFIPRLYQLAREAQTIQENFAYHFLAEGALNDARRLWREAVT